MGLRKSKKDPERKRKNVIKYMVFSAGDLRPPAPGAVVATGEPATWGAADDESQPEVEEDPLEEDESEEEQSFPAWSGSICQS